MILIKPYYELIYLDNPESIMERIENAARVCYKSNGNGRRSPGLISKLINKGHLSPLEHCSASVKVVCSRGISHELVRHRLASFSQESTRYCNYGEGVTFIIPTWVDIPPGKYKDIEELKALKESDYIWAEQMLSSEKAYIKLLEQEWPPEKARTVLPDSLKTEIIITANLREWRHIFSLRALETTGRVHPQMKEIMYPLYLHFRKELPEIFEKL